MSNGNMSSDAIDTATIDIIRARVLRALHRGSFPKHLEDDLVQHIALVLLKRQSGFDPNRSSWRTFVRHVADRELRVIQRRTRSLPLESALDQESDPLEKVEARASSPSEDVFFEMDLYMTIEQLSSELQSFCHSYLKTPHTQVLCSELHLSRSTVHRRLVSLRAAFRKHAMNDYL